MSNASLVAALELIRDFPVDDADNKDVVKLRFIANKALKELEEQDDDEVMFSEEAGSLDRQRYPVYQPKDNSTFERVKAITTECFGGAITDKVVLTANFRDDFGADSLDLVELVMRFEEEFNIEVQDDVEDKVKTVEDAVKYVEDSAKV